MPEATAQPGTITTQRYAEKPAEISAAEGWFRAHYAPDSIAAMCGVKDGQASGLIYIPPVPPAVLQLILTLAQGMVKEAQA